ncbi:MAG: HAD family phosphatase [Lactobacillus sp.]|nr:HAD family phosphatase [Lactobacillus sp.]
MHIDGIDADIKGAIFDMDGLLIDSEHLYWKANIQASNEEKLGLPDDSYLKLAGLSLDQLHAFYKKYFPSEAKRDEFIKRTDDLVDQWIAEGKLQAKPGSHDLLELLKKNKIKLGIASSNHADFIERALKEVKLDHYFDFVLSYDDVVANNLQAKPAPDIYLAAAKEMQLPKENLVAFEDSRAGCTAIYQAGIHGIVVPDLLEMRPQEEKQADLICDSLEEVVKRIKI